MTGAKPRTERWWRHPSPDINGIVMCSETDYTGTAEEVEVHPQGTSGRIAELEAELRTLRELLSDLTDGLDANYDDRCGLTQWQWDRRVAEARAVLDRKEKGR